MKQKSILSRIVGTLALPVLMYVIMMILCFSNGKMYFGTLQMWQTLIVNIALSVTCAMGIGLQFKCGRFDFSGGAIMLLSAIIAGNIARDQGNNIVLLFLLSFLLCIGFSLLVALFYVFGRVPIVISTIGMALLYEALTCLIYGGRGVNLVSNMTLRIFSTYPAVLLPLIIAIVVYVFYSYFTVSGKQAALLAGNQQAAINIGINERKNVLISYLFSGIIFGAGTLVYLANGIHGASFNSMSTVGELFSNILPVFIGLIVAPFCGDAIGILVGSVTLCLMSYGLTAVFTNEMGASISIICTGVFVLLINVFSAQGQLFRYRFGKRRRTT